MGLEVFLVTNKLVITLVLYQEKLSETPSYDVLKQLVENNSSVYLFFYDNSQFSQTDDLFLHERVHYHHDATNPGLAVAYNTAVKFLNKVEADLLLLLDQDTVVPEEYLKALLGLELTEDVGVYVPIVSSHGRQISPVFSNKYIDGRGVFPKAGNYSEHLMGINSGTALPKEILQKISGFNLAFPLDFLDHWLFWEIYQQHKKTVVLNYHLEHDLSVLDYQNINIERYESIIKAETLFYSQYDRKKIVTHRNHLFLRMIKQFFKVKNRKIWRRTFWEFTSLLKGK